MERLIQQTLNLLARLGNSEQVILLRIIDNNIGIVAGGIDANHMISPGEHIKFGNTPLEEVIHSQQIHTLPCVQFNTLPCLADQNALNHRGCLCLPLFNENKHIVGIVILSQKPGIPLLPERLQTLDLLRTLIATLMEVSAESDLLQLATVDTLTSLYTKRYFDNRLQEEFTRVRRHGGVISILLIDIDHFKQVSENFGFQESNRVLQKIAKIITSSIRKEIDIPCRYDNKKFIILLPNTDVDGAYILAERIRKRCMQQHFTTLRGLPLKITISAGIAHNVDIAHDEESEESAEITQVQPASEVSKEELIHRADMMLSAAKQAGCNQVMVWW